VSPKTLREEQDPVLAWETRIGRKAIIYYCVCLRATCCM